MYYEIDIGYFFKILLLFWWRVLIGVDGMNYW